MSDFTSTLEAFAEQSQVRLGQAARLIKIALFQGVIQDTRVDTGRLRGNWQTSTGSPILSTTERESTLPPKQVPPDQADEIDGAVTDAGVDYITNNLPYAAVWNREDGIISQNLARVPRIVEEATRGQR